MNATFGNLTKKQKREIAARLVIAEQEKQAKNAARLAAKKLAEKRAEIAAEKRAAYEALKAAVKQYSYLTVDGKTYTFPKTAIHPDLFAKQCTRLGLDSTRFKLSAVKPRNSTPIAVGDFRGAFYSATRTIPNTKKVIVWATIQNPKDAADRIAPTSIGIWVD